MDINPLIDFLGTPYNNEWIVIHPFKIYVRNSKHYILDQYRNMLDLANISVIKPSLSGKGSFTELLSKIEDLAPLEGIYIENVLDPRFAAFFDRRGYVRCRIDEPSPSFYKIY